MNSRAFVSVGAEFSPDKLSEVSSSAREAIADAAAPEHSPCDTYDYDDHDHHSDEPRYEHYRDES